MLMSQSNFFTSVVKCRCGSMTANSIRDWKWMVGYHSVGMGCYWQLVCNGQGWGYPAKHRTYPGKENLLHTPSTWFSNVPPDIHVSENLFISIWDYYLIPFTHKHLEPNFCTVFKPSFVQSELSINVTTMKIRAICILSCMEIQQL